MSFIYANYMCMRTQYHTLSEMEHSIEEALSEFKGITDLLFVFFFLSLNEYVDRTHYNIEYKMEDREKSFIDGNLIKDCRMEIENNMLPEKAA